jgi:antibiotic biosynthesis monooxygenase (ABM) superfamily enzyme
MIARIWHGWTTPENSGKYEALLREEIFAGILDRNIQGFRDIRLLRRDLGSEVEFITIMHFDSLDSVKTFAGEDWARAVVPSAARTLLSRFDAESQHYEVTLERTQP